MRRVDCDRRTPCVSGGVVSGPVGTWARQRRARAHPPAYAGGSPRLLLAVVAIVLTLPAAAHAHGSPAAFTADARPRSWGELAVTWGFEWPVVLPLVLIGGVYLRGLLRTWRKAGVGHGIRRWEAGCFAGGWLALAVALVSPLHPWGNVLFAAHMAQHEILMLVAAPLIVLGKPVVALLHGLPVGWAKRLAPAARLPLWAVAAGPLFAFVFHAAVLWMWHVPPLFRGALQYGVVHAAQHLSFTLAAAVFWWSLLRGAAGPAVLSLFGTALHTGLLGALLTFSKSVWYDEYLATTAPWGLTPLEDQQLGGLIMWVPACSIYIVAGLVLFAGWLRAIEARASRPPAWLVPAGGPTP
jgi:putative membrane protein